MTSSDDLRGLTHEYWQHPSRTRGGRVKWYIEKLLFEELDYARGRQMLQAQACDTLALLVGYSPEPLLQAICVFQPARIIFLLNRRYGEQEGLSYGDDLQEWVEDWLLPPLNRRLALEFPDRPAYRPAIEAHEVDDRPEAVFRALCEHVLPDQRCWRHVIVDITGAKKSMDAGAFLFAAYADIPISYVDFEEYDEDRRRPFGFTCRIGSLANPYHAFRLRDWERVRQLYGDYHFRAAAGALKDIQGIMAEPMFQSDHIQAAQNLLKALYFYAAWDDGDHHGAQQQLPAVRSVVPEFERSGGVPAAVELLATLWPDMHAATDVPGLLGQLLDSDGQPAHPAPHVLLESNQALIVYARDELAKIKRLADTNEDNRSALLRAAGLEELLLKARWVRLWQANLVGVWEVLNGYKTKHIGQCLTVPDPSLRQQLYEAIIRHQDSVNMRRALLKQDPKKATPAYLKLDIDVGKYRVWPVASPDTPMMSDGPKMALTSLHLHQLRNQAIHMYLYVIQSIAQAAVDLAEASLDDFVKQWAGLSGGNVPAQACVTRLPWDELCRLCKLDFLPLTLKSKNGGNV